VWAAARCRDKLGDYQQKLGKNRPLQQDNKMKCEDKMEVKQIENKITDEGKRMNKLYLGDCLEVMK